MKDLPVRELIDTLDFVNNNRRGVDWIDDLRSQPTSIVQKARASLPWPLRRLSASPDEKPGIELARRLRARDNVLSANVAHFDFLAKRKISANHFANEVRSVLSQHGDHSICIYKTQSA